MSLAVKVCVRLLVRAVRVLVFNLASAVKHLDFLPLLHTTLHRLRFGFSFFVGANLGVGLSSRLDDFRRLGFDKLGRLGGLLWWVVVASHLVRHSLRVHVRRLHPRLIHSILGPHPIALEVRVLNVAHRTVHVRTHSVLVYVGRATVLRHGVSVEVILAGLRVHPWAVHPTGWLLGEARATVVVRLGLYIAAWAHLLLEPLASTVSHLRVTREPRWRRLVAVCVIAWLPPLRGIV